MIILNRWFPSLGLIPEPPHVDVPTLTNSCAIIGLIFSDCNKPYENQRAVVNVLKNVKNRSRCDIWFPPATEICRLNNSGSIDKPAASELPSGLRQLTCLSF
jgi:hypothetical protein